MTNVNEALKGVEAAVRKRQTNSETAWDKKSTTYKKTGRYPYHFKKTGPYQPVRLPVAFTTKWPDISVFPCPPLSAYDMMPLPSATTSASVAVLPIVLSVVSMRALTSPPPPRHLPSTAFEEVAHWKDQCVVLFAGMCKLEGKLEAAQTTIVALEARLEKVEAARMRSFDHRQKKM